jgi:general L-amino acid transport system substrate-binding protein
VLTTAAVDIDIIVGGMFTFASTSDIGSDAGRHERCPKRWSPLTRSAAFRRSEDVGAGSKLGIARGLNQLWNKGGIQYAPPIR